MHEYLIALGANLGDREYYIERAHDAIHTRCGPIVLSSKLRETVAIGAADQAFLNAALVCSSTLTPQQVLEQLLTIENELGRVRTVRWGNRTIDLDIILWKDSSGKFPSVKIPNLRIPHPEMHLRSFVLEAAAEVAPDWIHPELGKTIGDLWRQFIVREHEP